MDKLKVIKELYAAFGRGDVGLVLAAFAPNIEWRQAEGNPYQPSGAPWFGGEAITQELFVKLGAEWDGFIVTPKVFHDAGDTVVAEGRYTGTFKATGKDIDAQFCHMWKLMDGKIVGFQQYVDTAQLQDAMGIR